MKKNSQVTITLKDFNEYIDFVGGFIEMIVNPQLFLFRGQLIDKPLIPKIGRLGISDVKVFENDLFEDFSKRYVAFSEKKYDNALDLLALGQHFGLPTRLLDWSENALVALWFATEKEINESYSVVWMFMPDQDDIINTKLLNPFTLKSTKVFCPNHISQRITAQSGWFTCHKLMSTNTFLRFETLAKYKQKLIKIKIPKKLFPEIRLKLNSMGVNSSTVYPDLAGLAAHLNWKHLGKDRV